MAAQAITPARWAMLIVLLLGIGAAGVVLVSQVGLAPGPTTAAQKPDAGPGVADFTLPDLDGQPVRWSTFVAGRPSVVSFGTTTCPYCNLQIEAFKQIRSRHGESIALLEVNVGESAERAAAHAARLRSPTKTLLDRTGAVYSRYGNGPVPITIVSDAKGKILEISGYLPAERILQLLGMEQASEPNRAAARQG